MKLRSTFVFTLALMVAAAFVSIDGQTRLRRPCASSTTPAQVELERDGDLSLRPCSGRSILVNGSSLTGILSSLNGLTAAAQTFAAPSAADTAAWSSSASTHTLQLPITAVSGGSRTSFLPFFDAANTLRRSGISWNLTSYRFDNANDTPNTNFPLVFTPQSVGNDGAFQVGSASSAQLSLSQAGSLITLTAPNLAISATNFSLNSSITAAGTTGNQTINQAVGTVNFAAGASSLTVTSSAAAANSIILAVARTNDATCSVKNVVPSGGSFVIRMTAACTAETSVGFWVIN